MFLRNRIAIVRRHTVCVWCVWCVCVVSAEHTQHPTHSTHTPHPTKGDRGGEGGRSRAARHEVDAAAARRTDTCGIGCVLSVW